MNATPRPWKVLWKYDTHKVKRDRDGRIIGPVTMDFDDYLYALHCVNTHNKAIQALRSLINNNGTGAMEWAISNAKALLAEMEG